MVQPRSATLLAAWKSFIAGASRLPCAIQGSLHPASEDDARKINAQLDLVREGIRLFDYALPVVGSIVLSIDVHHVAPLPVILCWLLIAMNSVTNECLLRSAAAAPGQDEAHVGRRAQLFSLMTLVQTGVWVMLLAAAWRPLEAVSNMFSLLLIACMLAAVCSRFAVHAASAAGPIALISSVILLMQAYHGSTRIMALFQLSIVYATMMIAEACAFHGRFNKAWRLEHEREELIENLRQAKLESDHAHERAVAASKAKSEFLANMSHELRTPLNAIIGFSDIVRSKAFGDADKYSEYGEFIHQSGHHLLELIGDILDLAKIEAGRKILRPEPIDIMSLVRDEVQKAATGASAKGLSITARLPQSLPLLQADLHAVRQIIDHLLSNAVKFSQTTGRVEVSLALNARHEIELTISDTGLGIAPEDQAHIFDRFGRGKPDVASMQRGTGLGLPIVKGLVDMHGGRIELESALGEGTRITVTFPASSTLEQAGLRVA